MVKYNKEQKRFDIDLGFCKLQFDLLEWVTSRKITDIEIISFDLFRYAIDGIEEYESVSRRIFSEDNPALIKYSKIHNGYQLERYGVSIITKLPLTEVVERIQNSCDREDVTWSLQEITN